MVNDSGTTHAPIFIINNKMDINKDKLSISCKLQLFGIYLYIYRKRERHNKKVCGMPAAALELTALDRQTKF